MAKDKPVTIAKCKANHYCTTKDKKIAIAKYKAKYNHKTNNK